MPVFYADASALVKLVLRELESPALQAFTRTADLVSCELVLTEVPRGIRRAAARDPALRLPALLQQAAEVLDTVGLVPLDRTMLLAAGALPEPTLRALDAVHVAAALAVSPIDAFISYDERQAATARLCGLRTICP